MREEVLYIIFLDLHKSYDALDRSRCLEILEGDGVGPQECRLLETYLGRLRMVAQLGGYYGLEFKGSIGEMKGEPLSPIIINVVVDVVVRHWVTVIVESAEERNGRGQEVRHQNSLFYADDVMVVSSCPRWLQGSFNTLLGLLNRVGLKTSVGKTVGMVCRPFQAAGMQLATAYGRRMTVVGNSYQERQRGRFQRMQFG